MRRVFCLIAFFIVAFVVAQNKKLDSLWQVYHSTMQSDTDRLKAINTLAKLYRNNNPDTAIILLKEQLQMAIDKGNLKFQSVAYNTMGVAYMFKSNYPKALENYLKALKLAEQLNNIKGVASCYTNIGTIYKYQEDFKAALQYYTKALEAFKKVNDKIGQSNCYNNIGVIQQNNEQYDKAMEYYSKSLKLREELHDTAGFASTLMNMGDVYQYQFNYPKAIEYYHKAFNNYKKFDDEKGMGECLMHFGEVYLAMGDYKKSIIYSDSSANLNRKVDNIDYESQSYDFLAKAYAKMGNYKMAYENNLKFQALTDSIFSDDKTQQLNDLKTQFEVEKKETELKAKADAQQAINVEEKKRQQLLLALVCFILVLVAVFSVFLFRRFKITQRQKQIIELQKNEVTRQKHIVEEHQKEIIDSITYAKRLQQAILPSDEEIKKYLPDNFIYYKPKDIVAGDFYWMHPVENENFVFIAAADSTGHGVPGAMVSVVCSNALNRAVKEFKLRTTGDILNKTRELVLETFEKSGEEIKDGMDISLMRIKTDGTIEVQWSGANNPLLYISNNELKEIKPDKQPIGKTDNPLPFTTHNVHLYKNDIVYLMTDGYPDQFGGNKGKKFKYKQLEAQLLANVAKPLAEQKSILAQSFEDWKGNLEQVDDVTIIGIKL